MVAFGFAVHVDVVLILVVEAFHRAFALPVLRPFHAPGGIPVPDVGDDITGTRN